VGLQIYIVKSLRRLNLKNIIHKIITDSIFVLLNFFALQKVDKYLKEYNELFT
jgi:hypothetical protein